jgi:hypothetical protein
MDDVSGRTLCAICSVLLQSMGVKRLVEFVDAVQITLVLPSTASLAAYRSRRCTVRRKKDATA